MWKQEYISMCYSESSGKDWISFHMEKQQHKHSGGYFYSPTKICIFLRGYSNTEPPFEFLRQNDNISQELDGYFIQATVPACTVTELPPDSSFISMTQGRSLWPDLFFLQPLLQVFAEASMNKIRLRVLWGCIHIFLSCATGSCLVATNSETPD